MKHTSTLAFAAGVLATASVGALIASGPDHDHASTTKSTSMTGEPMGEMSPEEMMAAYMALGAPGPKHEELKKSAGYWNAKTSFAMDPSTPDLMTEGEGVCTVEMVMGGRFAKTKFESDFVGMPFVGYAYNGYDNGRKEHVSVWMDTMSTSITYMTGQKDKNGDLVFKGEAYAPGNGEYQMKIINHWDDDDHWSQTFYDQLPDGTWFKSGTISYARK